MFSSFSRLFSDMLPQDILGKEGKVMWQYNQIRLVPLGRSKNILDHQIQRNDIFDRQQLRNKNVVSSFSTKSGFLDEASISLSCQILHGYQT